MQVAQTITAVSAGLFLLVAFICALRLVQAWILHRTLRDAINRDSALAETMIERIAGPERAGADADDRTGLVLVALGLATAAFALLAGGEGWLKYCLGGAFFPSFVGAALLLRHHLAGRAAKHDIAKDG
jgi:hypothetical protein